jgi:phosphoglucosamine mutase
MGKYFGTDGIRGIANIELDSELSLKIGRAIGTYLLKKNPKGGLVGIGKDTRLSGDMIEASLISGLLSVGISTESLGVIPTPAVSRLVSLRNYISGIVISASHNPIDDNGIKLFSDKGLKLDDEDEDTIEILIDYPDLSMLSKGKYFGKSSLYNDSSNLYINNIHDQFQNLNLNGVKVLVDCAYGSTSITTPKLLTKLGANVISINSSHDGERINVNCGSTHPEYVINYAIKNNIEYDIGFAHDGDGDIVICFLNNGRIIDGDIIMSLCALHRMRNFKLRNNKVIGTIMTNTGIENFLNNNGIDFYRSQVGDKYVLKDMLKYSADIGGEQSGHIIFIDKAKTGDGLVTILEFLKVLVETEFKILEELNNIKFYNQILHNIRVSDKFKVAESQILKNKINDLLSINKSVRINVRPSGTEPYIRILVEAEDEELTKNIANEIKVLVEAII